MQVRMEGKLQLCFYCGYKNPNFFNLRNHIKRNHPEHGEKKHLWDFCGEVFMFLTFVEKSAATFVACMFILIVSIPSMTRKTLMRPLLGKI